MKNEKIKTKKLNLNKFTVSKLSNITVIKGGGGGETAPPIKDNRSDNCK